MSGEKKVKWRRLSGEEIAGLFLIGLKPKSKPKKNEGGNES